MKVGDLVEHPMFGVGIVMEVQARGYPLIVKFYQPVHDDIGSQVVHVDRANNMVYISHRHVKVVQ